MSTACLRGPNRCAERTIVEGGVAAGEAVYGPLCATDHGRVRAALEDLPWLRLQLQLSIGEPQQGDGGTSRVHPEIPIREDIDALIRELDRVVFSWSEALEDELRLSPARKFGPAARRLLVHLGNFYALGPTPVSRWVNAEAVAALPLDTVGTVRSSGEAVIVLELTGGQGALEVLRLYQRGCSILRWEGPSGNLHIGVTEV